MEEKNNLIILATYWNESFWIDPSLDQIKKLNPKEVIICDGCFDPRVPNYSTDGTRKIIENFVRNNQNARMISALRPGYIKSLWMLLRGHKKLSFWTIFRSVRWKFLLKSMFMSSYRRNQAITFNYMISISQEWEEGGWFMTFDADQFYSDEMIEKIKNVVNDKKSEFGLITGQELTFFNSFDQYNDFYEKRIYNNMPHRIYSDVIIHPTRTLIRETRKGRSSLLKKIWSKHLHVSCEKTKDAGVYFHYKINNPERAKIGYMLGDRKEPEYSRKKTKEYKGEHPSIIKHYFDV